MPTALEQAATLAYSIRATAETAEILIALLEPLGFEGFWEDEGRLVAYLPARLDAPEAIRQLVREQGAEIDGIEVIAPQNWNAVWESAYSPIELEDFCQVVADFHVPKPGFAHTLHIHPKMAFGTGHHATTRLVMRLMRGLDFRRGEVLDFGCGTGILGILAAALGAKEVVLVDNDPICTENTAENWAANPTEVQDAHPDIRLGGLEVVDSESRFDFMLANINRNVHMANGSAYYNLLRPGGVILLSGLLTVDLESISAYFSEWNFTLQKVEEAEGWIALQLQKPALAQE